jgi:hypothetical protein
MPVTDKCDILSVTVKSYILSVTKK